jgi:hypothetical protein
MISSVAFYAVLWTIAAAVALSGCAGQIPSPTTPTTSEIATAAVELQTANIPPADYASIGITLSQRACAEWFSQQTLAAQQTHFGTQALTMLGGVAAAAGGPVGAGAAVGASALANLLGSAQASFGAGSNPAAIYGLVSRIQGTWLAAMPSPVTSADAYALVEAFTEQCNLPAIQNAVMQALNAVPVSAAVPASVPSVAASQGSLELYTPSTPERSSRSRRAHRLTPSMPQTSDLQRAWESSGRPYTEPQSFAGRIPYVHIGP